MTELSALGIRITGTGIVKTTNDLDKFAVAAKAAGAAAKSPINVRIAGNASKVIGDIRAMEKALSGVRAATKGGIGIRVSTAGNAKAISDIANMGNALRSARAAARTPIVVRVSQTGAQAVIASLNQVTAAAERARAASGVNVRVNGGSGGGPTSADVSNANAMVGAIKSLVSAYALLAGVRAYATLVDESKMLTAQLKLATSETGSFVQAQKDVRAISIAVRADLDSTASLYGKLQLNSRELGLSQRDVAKITTATAQAFKVSGASTVEASQGIRQLVQGLQSGVLRGDEFNTIMEAAPRLSKAMADSLGVTTGKLRKMAEEGKLTGGVVSKAILDASEQIGKDFSQLPVTFGDAMNQIRNAAVITFGAFDEGGQFSKSITSFLIGGTKGMEDWENAAFRLGQTVSVEFAKIGAAFDAVQQSIDMVSSAFAYLNTLPVISPVIGWLGDVISQVNELASWLNPISALFNVIGQVGEKAAQTQRMQNADKAFTRASDRLFGNVQDFVKDYSPTINRNTAATVRATKATKGLTDAQREAKRVADEQKRAYDQKVKAADDYIASLQRENAEFGKTAKELRLMEVARRMEAAATDKQREAIQAASNVREMNIGTKELTDAKALADQREREIQLINDETEAQRKAGKERMAAMRGMSGDALENELARINDEYEIQNILLRAQAAAANDAANAVHIMAKAHAEVAQVRLQQGQANDERTFEQNKQKTLGLAYDIADIVGGCFGDGAREVIRILEETLPGVFADLGKEFGVAFEAFSKGAKTGGVFGAMTGSTTGGQIGGGLGQVLGKEFLTKGLESISKGLGKFAGPLGAIAGGILGGVIGGLLKKTPKASATVSIIAGEAMDTAITGNKSSLKKIAGGLADSVIAGLSGLADQLGADLIGNAKVSIGIRKKNYRVDPTGMGRTKGAGVEDFGEDQAAAIAFAIQTAIQQGVLGGLSESMKRLIMADGDFQAQLQKAMSFKSVFDELAQNDDPAKYAQDQITKWHDAMAKIFAEAGATGDELAELERLTGIKRADAAKAAAEAIAATARAALEKESQLNEKRAQILELEGKSRAATNLSRQIELSTMDEAEAALQRRIYALQDEKEVADAAAEMAKRIGDERYALGVRLLELEGNTAALRVLELAAIEPVNRELQTRVWLLEDAAAAEAEANAKAKAIADERYNLETQLLQLQENTAVLRERELAALDPTNRAIMQQIYALTDLKAANEAATAAADAAAKALEDAAAAQKAIADEAYGLQTRYLQLIGDTAELRKRELEALNPANRALLQQIFAEEDRQAALEAAQKANEEYIASLNDQAGNLAQVAERMRGFAQTIREFKSSLTEQSASSGGGYARALAQFQSTSRMASLGNEDSLGAFVGDAQAFLEAAKNNARSALDYRRAVSMVAANADSAIGGAEGLASAAEQQIAGINATVAQLQNIGALAGTQVNAIELTNQALTDQVVPAIEDTVGGGLDAIRLELVALRKDATDRRGEEKAEAVATVTNLSTIAAILRRADRGDSIAMSVEDVLSVIVGNSVTVTNTASTPLFTDEVP